MWSFTPDPSAVQEKFGYHLGDRVVFIETEDCDGGVFLGCKGIICDLDESRIGIRWDSMKPGVLGHTCSSKCDRYGWYVDPHTIMLEIMEEPIELDSGDLAELMEMI